MNSATQLAAPSGGTQDFGSYIVPRSEKSYYVPGALLRRIIALVGGGAKALQYFIFGPEISFPGNCYSDAPPGGSVNSPPGTLVPDQLRQQQQAHEMIGAAESVLWEARPVPARVAILKDRSSSLWDPSGTAKWPNLTEYSMAYRAEIYGLFLAISVHGGCSVDFVSEEALLNSSALQLHLGRLRQ